MNSLREPGRYMNPYLAGMLLGVVLFGSIMLTREGLGASGGMRACVAATADAVAPRQVDKSPFLASAARTARHPLDQRLVWVLAGAVLGAATSGAIFRRLRPEVFRGPRVGIALRLAAALVGGAFMGYGSQWARGCTSGQALSGGAVLSAGSWALMFAIFGGAYALAWPLRRLWR